MKVFISPNPDRAGTNNGIGRVVKAQYDYLPNFGVELVTDPNEADVIAAHIHGFGLPQVDVLHCHGLHWEEFSKPETDLYDRQVNRAVLDAARQAYAVTVPSEWVAMPFKRDMRLSPVVIGHGIDLSEWQPLPLSERVNYLLWNKNRWDNVCDPTVAIELAKRGLPVVSTFGNAQAMQVTGLISYEQMREMVRHAGIYLATTKETFGIGTLEALASGIPVLGYDIGGTSDLVRHKENGYLVSPGDVQGLYEGYQWLTDNLQKVSDVAVLSAQLYDWPLIIGQYAALYQEVWERKKKPTRVAVVITNHNYKEYVGGAIESCLAQTEMPEIIVVDDASTDGSMGLLQSYAGDPRIQIVSLKENVGVASARNTGIAATSAEHIVCLDADDWLEPTYIQTLSTALQDRTIGIAYTGLRMHFANGETGVSGWPPEYDFDSMAKPTNPPSNCVPVAAMFRRSMWERSGGYLQEHAPGEDAEFFLRGASLGFVGRRVTTEPLFNYRLHQGSHSRTKEYKKVNRWNPWMLDHEYPMAAPTVKQARVKSYSQPVVSVIIPVGPGHMKYLHTALQSLEGQTFRDWEAIVINDSGEYVDEFLKRYPYATFDSTKNETRRKFGYGAGAARNVGLKNAKAPLTLFLDSDDWLEPEAIEKMVKAYAKAGGRYIYTDWVPTDTGQVQGCLGYDPAVVIEKKGIHAVTVLIATDDAKALGFREDLPAFEDNEFFMRCAAKGVHGQHLAEPLLHYRVESSTRRVIAAGKPLGQEIIQGLEEEYKGVEIMACCGGGGQQISFLQQYLNKAAPPEVGGESGAILMEYIGQEQGGISYYAAGKSYTGAASGPEQFAQVDPAAVDQLLQTGKWKRV
jgi:glycosyltransferase involved in cell wall biosynthesis